MTTTTLPRATASTGSRSRRGALFVAVMVASVVVAASCVPTTTPVPNPAGLRAILVTGGIDLTWSPTIAGAAHGYDLQFLSPSEVWTDLPDPSSNQATFTDVAPRQRYTFRVRSGTAPGTPVAPWSPTITTLYVEPQLPVVRIDTVGAQPILDRDNYVAGSMTIDPNGSAFAPYSGTLTMKGRGNSTWTYPKKPYKLKLDTRSPIMGMASQKDWVLLANFVDRSQLRTYAAGEISRATELDWTPSFRHVEVVLNGDYLGVYQLAEQVEVKSNRVDITEMEPTDIAGEDVTGGYLMEIDGRLEENSEPGWRTGRNVAVVVKEPEPMVPQQLTYIRNHVQAFEDSLFSPSYADPTVGFRRYLDVDAFADHYLVQELTNNQDVFYSSTYFTKERGDERLRFGPIWDFDRSMGTLQGVVELPPTGWRARDRGSWSLRLFTDPTFVSQVHTRWDTLRPAVESLPSQLVTLGAQLEPAIDNDAERWRYTPAPTDEPEFLADWLSTRIAWMDQEFDAGP